MPLTTAPRLLSYLPAIYREDPSLGQFLAPFEEILFGSPDPGAAPGLEESIAGLAKYFDPQSTPSEFLDWLSHWVAMDLRGDLDEVHRRDFISNAALLFRHRGTPRGIADAVQTYTRLAPTITEDPAKPHRFKVLLRIAESDPAKRKKYMDIATAIINAEKPAHTMCDLDVETPAMQIAVHSTIGVDTLLSIPGL